MVNENETDPRKQVHEWRECVEDACGHKEFFISVAEKDYFESKKDAEGKPFNLPKRCYQCRVRLRKPQN